MINEERMSVYVRLGIRLLYKGLKSRRMEKDKSKSSQPASRGPLLSTCENNTLTSMHSSQTSPIHVL